MNDTATSSTPSLDTIFDALADEHRRRLLVTLLERDPEDENLRVPEDVASGDADHESFEIQLIHVHLPKLDDWGFVDWNRRTDEVRRGPRFGEVRQVLELVRDHPDHLPHELL